MYTIFESDEHLQGRCLPASLPLGLISCLATDRIWRDTRASDDRK